MKTTTKLIGVVAIAMVLSIAFSGVALASQPCCPPPETSSIKTVTMISCEGMVTEMEKMSWETSNENLLNNPPLAGVANPGVQPPPRIPQEVVGKLQYKQDLKVTDGITKFVKDMDIDTGSDPNLNVMKSIGYVQADTIGSLSHDEEVSMGLVANWVRTNEVVLCPFAGAQTTILPASCENVDASSSIVVTDVLETTITKVGMSEDPVELHYSVDTTGSGGAGTPAHGHIAIEFNVYTEDGSAWNERGSQHCEGGRPWRYDLGATLKHEEKTTADGLWEVHKEMDYKSKLMKP